MQHAPTELKGAARGGEEGEGEKAGAKGEDVSEGAEGAEDDEEASSGEVSSGDGDSLHGDSDGSEEEDQPRAPAAGAGSQRLLPAGPHADHLIAVDVAQNALNNVRVVHRSSRR